MAGATTTPRHRAPSPFRRGVAGLWRDVRESWRPVERVWDYVPISVMGVVVTALGAWAVWGVGEDSADFVIYAAGACALALVAVSIVTVGAAAFVLFLQVRKRPSGVPETLMAGVEATTSFRCPTLRFWPLVQVATRMVEPPGVSVVLEPDGAELVERVTPAERGRWEHVVRRVAVTDIFGFASLAFRRRWDQPVRVIPAVGRADTELAVRRATSDGFSHPSGKPIGELVEMRRYTYGDPLRHVIWKTFARDRNLMVREPEKAIAPKPAMVAFFVAAPLDDPSASTARLFLENDLLGADFMFMAEGATGPTANRGEALEQVIRSSAHRASQADGLGALFRAVDRARLDNLVIFAPASDGPWVDKVLTLTRRLPMPPMVVLTVDGALDAARRSWLSRFLWEHDDTTNPTLLALPALHDRLRAAHADVRVIHRPTGARLHGAQIDALRSLN
ncbi:MAG: DUF58 domain-containing protein [Deltaproteobacteria bacterium]|nr:DUF58 domain-containing protein [Deltaproteobacteria bacterium]